MAGGRQPHGGMDDFPILLRRHLAKLETVFGQGGGRDKYPKSAEALRRFRVAVLAEVPDGTGRKGLHRQTSGAKLAGTRKYYMRWYRATRENKRLKSQVEAFTDSKAGEAGCQIAPEWLCRIFLSAPAASARSVERAFKDVLGADTRTVSSRTIARVGDAWVEMYREMVLDAAAARVAAAVAATGASVNKNIQL